MCAPARPVPWSGGTGGPGGQEMTGCCAVGSAPALGAGGPGFESLHSDQLRNSHHRSVSGFAENCTLVGISSLSTATRFAGLAAEGERGNARGGEKSILPTYCKVGKFRKKLVDSACRKTGEIPLTGRRGVCGEPRKGSLRHLNHKFSEL